MVLLPSLSKLKETSEATLVESISQEPVQVTTTMLTTQFSLLDMEKKTMLISG